MLSRFGNWGLFHLMLSSSLSLSSSSSLSLIHHNIVVLVIIHLSSPDFFLFNQRDKLNINLDVMIVFFN